MFGFFKRQPPAVAPAPLAEAPPRGDALVEAVLMSGVVLPPYPAVLAELDHLLAEEDFELPRLVDLVGRDPSLRAALLRVANSPVFGPRQPVSGLLQAITVLGLARARSVLVSAALRDALRDYGDPMLVRALWARFSAIGNLAASLASHSATLRQQADLAYTTGMFHGTGAFILAKRFPGETRVLAHAGRNFEDELQRLGAELGSDPARISAMVARNWHLPAEVAEAIARQRLGPQAIAESDTSGKLVCLLHLAIGRFDDGEAAPDWRHDAEMLGLDGDALDEILATQGAAE